MASLFQLLPDCPDGQPNSASERFTWALISLTRTVWHADCSFETALRAICEAAAEALQVDRVSVWQYDREAGVLRSLCAYDARLGRDAPQTEPETLSLAGDDYMSALKNVRAFDAADVDDEPELAGSHAALRDYLGRHRIHGMLDAPAFVGGELLGVICHESVDRPRIWAREEMTFAGSMGDFVAMAWEISRRRRAEQEVHHLRLHDATTGLPNRDYMVEVVAQRMGAPDNDIHTLAVVHLRVDASGGVALPAEAPTVEDVMAGIGLQLRRLASDNVHLARVRADAFAFVLAGPGKRPAIRLAEEALAAVRLLQWGHAQIDPSAAAGIAFAEPGDVLDPRVLMRQAEEAAERARTGDKFAYEVFDAEHHDGLVEALRVERSMRDAFARGDFELHYQPERDVAEARWVAAEALLRWRDGDRLVVAGEFIGVVESSGLILPMGVWVLQQACRDAAAWPFAANGHAPSVRVNVSPRQFDETSLVDDVTAALESAGLAPERLCLELTETTLMRNIDHALEVLSQLKARGIQVAIDDFGTGYASLVYLKRLPIDVLKIDRSFVEGVPGQAVDTAIVRSVVGLAVALGIEVVAEGVEHFEQQAALHAIGVSRMQGWFYSKAIEQSAMHALLSSTAH